MLRTRMTTLAGLEWGGGGGGDICFLGFFFPENLF